MPASVVYRRGVGLKPAEGLSAAAGAHCQVIHGSDELVNRVHGIGEVAVAVRRGEGCVADVALGTPLPRR